MSLDQAFFLGIALVGALFLLVSFVIGEIGDFFDDVGDTVGDAIGIGGGDVGTETGGDIGDEGPSPLSLRSVMAFLTAYGASGLITSAYGWSTLASSLFAIVPGGAMAVVAYQVMKQLYAQQATSVVEVGGLTGSTGVVDVAIPAAGIGRVTVSTHAGSSTFIARSQDGSAIAHGERIVVRAAMGNELVVARADGGN